MKRIFLGMVFSLFLAFALGACGDDGVGPPDFNPGPPCAADVNGDGAVNVIDLIDVLLNFGQEPDNPAIDLDGDGEVGPEDLQFVLDQFGLTGC